MLVYIIYTNMNQLVTCFINEKKMWNGNIFKNIPMMDSFIFSLYNDENSYELYEQAHVECDNNYPCATHGVARWYETVAILSMVVLENDDLHKFLEFLLFNTHTKENDADQQLKLSYAFAKICSNTNKIMLDLIIKYSAVDQYVQFVSQEYTLIDYKPIQFNCAYIFENGCSLTDGTIEAFIDSYSDKMFGLLELFFNFFPETMIEKFTKINLGYRKGSVILGLNYWIENGGMVNKIAPQNIMPLLFNSKCEHLINILCEHGYDFSNINNLYVASDDNLKISNRLERLDVSPVALNSFYLDNYSDEECYEQ